MSELRRALNRQVDALRAVAAADHSAAWRPVGREIERAGGLVLLGSGSSRLCVEQGADLFRSLGFAVTADDLHTWSPPDDGPSSRGPVIAVSHRSSSQGIRRLRRWAEQGNVVQVVGADGTGADVEVGPVERTSAVTSGYTSALAYLMRAAEHLGGPRILDDAVSAAIAFGPGCPDTPGFVPRFVDVVGSASGGWAAKEAAQKLREAARIPSSGWSVNDYVHGAFASLSGADHVVIVDGGGSANIDPVATAARDVGAAVVRISGMRGAVDTFVVLVQVHRYAHRMARLAGAHPDTLGADDVTRRAAWRRLRRALNESEH